MPGAATAMASNSDAQSEAESGAKTANCWRRRITDFCKKVFMPSIVEARCDGSVSSACTLS
jgi:hypothetical protein